MTDPQPLIAVEGLTVGFGKGSRPVEVVRGLGFTVGRGETVALVGESGSGKSVSALSIMRLVEREGGRILAGAVRFTDPATQATVDLTQAEEDALRRIRGDRIAMIFQEPMTSLNPVFTIGDQLAEAIVLHQRVSKSAALALAEDMLKRVRLTDPARRLGQYPHELSGGMRQRVMIAMALSCRPALLIADEPTTALDVTVQGEVLALIRELQREIGMAVLFITHDLGVVAEVADRVVVMRHGEKVEEAPVRDLFAAPVHAYTRTLIAAVPRLGEAPVLAPPSGDAPVLAVEGLTKLFPVRRGLFRRLAGHVHAADDVSFELKAGETLGLVGESGCGKSTTGRALMRLVAPTAGRIRLAGEELTALDGPALRRARRDVQMVFQDPYASLNPRLTIFESVTEPLAIHEPGLSRRERRDRAAGLLERVGLPAEHLDRYPHQFSGGQRQRLAIARALCLGPKVIVADEPVSALDVSVRAQVIALLRELQRDLGLAYLFVSHDMAVIEQVSHRVAVMVDGQIVEIGPTKAVLFEPRHPYTRKLIAAVPIPDPARRRQRTAGEAEMQPSPIRPIGWQRPASPLVEVGPGHFARAVSGADAPPATPAGRKSVVRAAELA
jgi:ABC-type microcin C transport system duplicated ATPase subunit YejF